MAEKKKEAKAEKPPKKPKAPKEVMDDLAYIEENLDSFDPEDRQDALDYREYIASQYDIEPDLGDKAWGAAEWAWDKALSGLDYLGGWGRTLTADAVDALVGSGDAVTSEDYAKALRGKAPGTSQYMERMGVPEGPRLSDTIPGLYSDDGEGIFTLKRGGAFDPTARGAGGFVGDILLDPATYATFGTNALVKLGGKAAKAAKVADVILRPSDKLLQWTGKAIYKRPFKALDAESKAMGKKIPFSDLAWDELGVGSKTGLAHKAAKLSDHYDKVREGLYKQADDAGARVNLDKAVLNAEANVADMAKIPSQEEAADAIDKLIARHRKAIRLPDQREMEFNNAFGQGALNAGRSLSMGEASSWKTGLYDTLPNSAFSQAAKTTEGHRVVKEFARDIDKAMVDEANRVVPGLGDQISNIDDRWGTLLTSAERLNKEALKESQRRIVTAMDLLAGHALLGGFGPQNATKYLLMKKALDATDYALPMTILGKAVNWSGRTGVLDPVLRQELLMATGQRPSPWTLMGEEEDK